MRKPILLLLLALLAALTLAPTPASAAEPPAGPAFMLKAGQFALSLEGTWLAEQKFKRADSYRYYDSYGYSETSNDPKIDFKIKNDQLYMLKFTYGILDRLNAYAKAGVITDGKLEDTRNYQYYSPLSDTEKLKSTFVWALGLKGKVLEFGENKAGVVLGVEYLRYDDRKLSYDSGDLAPWMASDEGSLDYWQVEVSAIFYWPFKMFTPYAGVAYTYCEADYTLKWVYTDHTWEAGDFTLKDNENFMPLVGVFIPLGQHFTLDVQGVFMARTAGTLSLSYYF